MYRSRAGLFALLVWVDTCIQVVPFCPKGTSEFGSQRQSCAVPCRNAAVPVLVLWPMAFVDMRKI